MTSQNTSLFTDTLKLAVPAQAGRFVTSAGMVADSTMLPWGVTRCGGSVGNFVPVDRLGTAMVESGGIFASGDFVGIDAQGRAVLWTTGIRAGRAMEASGAAGQMTEISIFDNPIGMPVTAEVNQVTGEIRVFAGGVDITDQIGTGGGSGGSGGSAASTTLDFLVGLPAAFSLTRGGTDRLARNSLGKWTRYAGNTPRVHCNEIGTPLGLVFERSVVDKGRLGFNFASAPVDSSGGFFSTPVNLGMTPDPASLSQAGFDTVLTSALRFTAPSSENLLQIDTTTGNTNKHTLMGLVRDNQGSGGGTFSALSISGGSTFVPTVYDEWQLIKSENVTPTSAARISQVTCRVGHSFDLAGLWFVEAPYAPLPYWRTADNVQATVADEWASAPLSGITGYSAAGFVMFYEWYHDRPFSVDGEPLIVLGDSGASGDYIKLGGRADGTLRIEAYIGGAVVFTSDFAAPARSTNHVAAIRCNAGQWIAAVDGALSSAASISPSLANINTCYINKHGSQYGNQFARGMYIGQDTLTDAAFAAGAAVAGGFI